MDLRAERFKTIIKEHANVIKETILFQNIPLKDLGKFIINCNYKEMKPGKTIFDEGDDSLFLAILLSGEVEIFRDQEKIFTLGAPALLGEIGLFTGMKRNATAKAKDKAVILTIAQTKLDSLFGMDPRLSHKIHRNIILCLSSKINGDNQKIVSLLDALKQREKEVAKINEMDGQEFYPNELIADNTPLYMRAKETHKKRKHARVAVKDPSYCHVKLHNKRLKVKDISSEGMRINIKFLPEEEKVKFKEGHTVSGELCLKSGTFSFSGTVKVRFGESCGVEFNRFSEREEDAIHEVIQTLKKMNQVI